jgi:hypothetical protein
MAQLWLPGSFEFSFDFVDLCNEKIHIGSVKRLVNDLEAIRSRQNIHQDEVAALMQNGYKDGADFRSLAIFGLGVFAHVARKAHDNQLPLLLSF